VRWLGLSVSETPAELPKDCDFVDKPLLAASAWNDGWSHGAGSTTQNMDMMGMDAFAELGAMRAPVCRERRHCGPLRIKFPFFRFAHRTVCAIPPAGDAVAHPARVRRLDRTREPRAPR
jgi:hypothetical protein